MKRLTLTLEELKLLVNYEPSTGDFTWVYTPANSAAKAGDRAGFFDNNGYVIISLLGIEYKAHRLAFLYMTGSMPHIVDHEDRNTSNNKWDNLREASHSLNMYNSKFRSHNTSGHTGITLDKRYGTWAARIGVKGKSINLGTFPTKELAIAARKRAEVRYYGAEK